MARSWRPRPLGAASDADTTLESVRRSLARQSLLALQVGVIAAAVDLAYFSISGIYAVTPVLATAAAALILGADLALAAPPSTVAVVAVVQAVTRLMACWLLYDHGRAGTFGAIGIVVAGYRAGAWLSNRASLLVVPLLVTAVSWAPILNATVAHDHRLFPIVVVSNGIMPWLVGRFTAAGSAYVTELEQRDRRRHHEHHIAMEKALTDEREAIALDLHDVISHHVSAIGIHAGAARMALASHPPDNQPAVTKSLSAVESCSRAAMVDLRRQLNLLHGNHDASDRQPGLANIDELIDSVRKAGLAVELVVPTDTAVLPQSLDVTVFRIVQELLTNALRHGDGTTRLEVHYQGDRLVIIQSNPIAPQSYSGDSLHRGLDGIRHRAELFDGTFECDSNGKRHWRAVVSLPITTP